MQGRKAETIKEQIRHHDLGCNNCIYIEHNLSTGLYTTLRILKIQYLRVLKGILHKIDKGFIHRKVNSADIDFGWKLFFQIKSKLLHNFSDSVKISSQFRDSEK